MTEVFQHIRIQDYTYDLPLERIAMQPLGQRDASRVLIYRNGQISEDVFAHIGRHLPHDSLMVFNNTRVVQARLLFRKPTGALIELFCLEPAGAVRDIQLAFQQQGRSSWYCLIGNAKKWKQGPLAMQVSPQLTLTVQKGEPYKEGYIVHFEWSQPLSFAQVLEQAGKTPLPPYIGRPALESDKQRYQTIFARHSGSVAAPTAALHFTPEVMQSLQAKNIATAYLTLHVGAGTFKPVTTESIAQHQMHHEQIAVHRDSITALQKHCQGKVVCVGTTSLRTLESLYWLGVKIMKGYQVPPEGFAISQWEPYERPANSLPDPATALEAVVQIMEKNQWDVIHGETSLIIVPGYKIKMAHALVTNFHQPGSTLLLLVAAFCGPRWRHIYSHALENEFRFLSYGDSCLLFP